jgi:hypothetical protein
VIIPDVSTSTSSYPVIKNATVVVASVQCMPGAKLKLRKNARLVELDHPACKPSKIGINGQNPMENQTQASFFSPGNK